MKFLTDAPNIGKTYADKLNLIGIANEWELKELVRKNVIIKIAATENTAVCINML